MSYSKTGIAILVGAAVLGAGVFWWNSPSEATKRAVKDALKDPSSAMFSDFTTCRGPDGGLRFVSGYVNARNSFGGMTGDQMFIATFTDDGSGADVRFDDADDSAYFGEFRRLQAEKQTACYNWPLEAYSAASQTEPTADELATDPLPIGDPSAY